MLIIITARLAWDPSQQANTQFVENTDYRNQGSYRPQMQKSPPDYKTNFSQVKNDVSDPPVFCQIFINKIEWFFGQQDPYAYFSDVWQENKSQKSIDVSPNKQLSSEYNFSRKTYDDTNKYKNESWDKREHFEEVIWGVVFEYGY